MEPMSEARASAAVQSGQCIGVASLRFLPKTSSLRPIVNLSCKIPRGPNKASTVNKYLQASLQVLKQAMVSTSAHLQTS